MKERIIDNTNSLIGKVLCLLNFHKDKFVEFTPIIIKYKYGTEKDRERGEFICLRCGRRKIFKTIIW